jgi:hypothetical protein
MPPSEAAPARFSRIFLGRQLLRSADRVANLARALERGAGGLHQTLRQSSIFPGCQQTAQSPLWGTIACGRSDDDSVEPSTRGSEHVPLARQGLLHVT